MHSSALLKSQQAKAQIKTAAKQPPANAFPARSEKSFSLSKMLRELLCAKVKLCSQGMPCTESSSSPESNLGCASSSELSSSMREVGNTQGIISLSWAYFESVRSTLCLSSTAIRPCKPTSMFMTKWSVSLFESELLWTMAFTSSGKSHTGGSKLNSFLLCQWLPFHLHPSLGRRFADRLASSNSFRYQWPLVDNDEREVRAHQFETHGSSLRMSTMPQ